MELEVKPNFYVERSLLYASNYIANLLAQKLLIKWWWNWHKMLMKECHLRKRKIRHGNVWNEATAESWPHLFTLNETYILAKLFDASWCIVTFNMALIYILALRPLNHKRWNKVPKWLLNATETLKKKRT